MLQLGHYFDLLKLCVWGRLYYEFNFRRTKEASHIYHKREGIVSDTVEGH